MAAPNITTHSTVGYGEGRFPSKTCLLPIFVIRTMFDNICSCFQYYISYANNQVMFSYTMHWNEMISPGDYFDFYRTSCGGWRPNGGNTSWLCENNEKGIFIWKLRILFIPKDGYFRRTSLLLYHSSDWTRWNFYPCVLERYARVVMRYTLNITR